MRVKTDIPCSSQETWVRAVLPLVNDPEQSLLNRLVELVDQVILERVLVWMKHQKPGKKGAARSSRKTRNAEEGTQGEDEVDEEDKPDATVWSLLSIMAARDLHRFLQAAVNLVLASSTATPRRLKDLMEALQIAALLSIEGEDGKSFRNPSQRKTLLAQVLSEGYFDATDALTDRRALRRGTWALLEAFFATSVNSTSGGLCAVPSDPGFVIRCWRKVYDICGEQNQQDEEDDGLDDDAHKILRVLARIASEVPADTGMELAEDLLAALVQLDQRLSPGNCGAALETISALCLAKGELTGALSTSSCDVNMASIDIDLMLAAPTEQEGAKICTQAARQILAACEKALQSFVVKRQTDPATLADLEKATFLTGAVAILGFSQNEEEAKKDTATKKSTTRRSRASKAGDDGESSSSSSAPLIRIPIPPATVSLIRVLLAPELLPLPATEGDDQCIDFHTMGESNIIL